MLVITYLLQDGIGDIHSAMGTIVRKNDPAVIRIEGEREEPTLGNILKIIRTEIAILELAESVSPAHGRSRGGNPQERHAANQAAKRAKQEKPMKNSFQSRPNAEEGQSLALLYITCIIILLYLEKRTHRLAVCVLKKGASFFSPRLRSLGGWRFRGFARGVLRARRCPASPRT